VSLQSGSLAVKGIRVVEKNFIGVCPDGRRDGSDTRHHLKKPQVLKAEAATALVPKLKHGTDDIWYIKYFIALWNPRTG
jgi:hypothetical protein